MLWISNTKPNPSNKLTFNLLSKFKDKEFAWMKAFQNFCWEYFVAEAFSSFEK